MYPRRATPAAAVQALVLVLALVGFTTVYRNARCFSTVNATRCYSLSGDHTDARSLFDGDFGPLEMLPSAVVIAPEFVSAVVTASPAPHVTPARRLALVASPWRRPPPAFA